MTKTKNSVKENCIVKTIVEHIVLKFLSISIDENNIIEKRT